jgi:hypothetical protein
MQTKQAANIAKVGLIILWLAFMYALTSCGSSHPRKCYRTKLKRCTLVVNDTIPDYFYVNNQIVMVEKENK